MTCDTSIKCVIQVAHKIKFYIGDVRDLQSCKNVMLTGVDYIFHAAALKQVPSCEFSQWKL